MIKTCNSDLHPILPDEILNPPELLPSDSPAQICVRWVPNIKNFFKFVSEYRKIISHPLGGSKKCRYSYTDPTITSVLSVGPVDSLSSLPQRISLSNFKLGPPIISYGCILRVVKESVPHYLLIKRKETPSYVDFIHGNYRESQLYFIIQELTEEERERILKYSFGQLWYDLHLKEPEGDSYKFGEKAFMKIIPHCKALFESTPSSDPSGKNLWLFPKGKINWTERPGPGDNSEPLLGPESPIECALREFKEETNGVEIKGELLFPNPLAERYLGSNSKNYQTDYFVFETDELPELTHFSRVTTEIRSVSDGEVDQVKWVPLRKLEKYLRPERLELIQYIEKHLPTGPVELNKVWSVAAEALEFTPEN